MEHDEYTQQLSAFLDDELTEAEHEAVLAHLDACEACRIRLAELSAIHDVLAEPEPADVPEGFAAGVLARLREEELPRRKKRYVRHTLTALAACAAVALLAVTAMPRMGGAGSSGSSYTQYAPAAADSAPAESAPAAMEEAVPEEPGTDADEAFDAAEQKQARAAEDTAAPAASELYGTYNAPEEFAASGDAGGTAGSTAQYFVTGAAEERTETTADAAEAEAAPVLTLTGEGAADWLAEHAEPLGGGRWLVSVEETDALPDSLELVAVDGLQEPTDGMLIITLETTENPR